MLQGLGPFLPPTRSSLHLLDDVVMWNALAIYLICLPGEEKGSFLEHWQLYFVLTVIGRDVGCCNIWTIWREAASFMSRLVHLINSNKANSVFWPSLHWEQSCYPYKMTQFFVSVSCKIPVISWDKHHQTSFLSKNILFICNIDEILALVNFDLSLFANLQHRTNSLQIAGLLETPATCSYTQADSSWVERPSWRSVSLFWLEANYIFLRTSHFFWLSSCTPFPHQQFMASQRPQTDKSGSESSETMGTLSNVSLEGTQQQRRHQWVRCEAANVANENRTQDAHFKIVPKTVSSANKKRHAIGCEYVHIMLYGRQLIEKWTAGIWGERCDQYLAAHYGKPSWSTKAFVRTVRDIEHQDVVSSAIFADGFGDKHPQEWMKKALNTLEEATEAFVVEVIADSHFQKQQLISSRFSTCLVLWQRKEVGYS